MIYQPIENLSNVILNAESVTGQNSETKVIVLTNPWVMSEEYRSVISRGLQTMMS